ncbi:MAG: hydroxymethylglutaryl-CoA synthase family protein [Spirulinaceae cyanobacterium]
MHIGIEKLNLYAGRLYLDIPELVDARPALDGPYVAQDLMCDRRTVYPAFEDGVTLAVNAVQRLQLTPAERASIELVIVGTESAVDCGKPISTWVQRLCGLGQNCRNFEVKHACYGATGALKMAAAWLATQPDKSKRALVINSDLSRKFLNTPYEPTGGGCALAMLVSHNPQILALDLHKTGYWTSEISDTFRPTTTTEVFNGQISLYSYLDALEGAYQHYEQTVGAVDLDADFQRHLYHAPFPGMPRQAHRTLRSLAGQGGGKAAAEASYQARVAPSIHFAKTVGMAYGGSNFLSLLGLLQADETLEGGESISLFAYGSGCQGEFYAAHLGAQAPALVRDLQIDSALAARQRVSVADYETLEAVREASIDRRDWHWQGGSEAMGNTAKGSELLQKLYATAYDGQELLVLDSVQGYERSYRWS